MKITFLGAAGEQCHVGSNSHEARSHLHVAADQCLVGREDARCLARCRDNANRAFYRALHLEVARIA